MEQIKLTDREIKEIYNEWIIDFNKDADGLDARIIKAQLKKVMEWLNTLEFFEDWGGEQAKRCRDTIVKELLKEIDKSD